MNSTSAIKANIELAARTLPPDVFAERVEMLRQMASRATVPAERGALEGLVAFAEDLMRAARPQPAPRDQIDYTILFGAAKLIGAGVAIYIVGCIVYEGLLAVKAFVVAHALAFGIATIGIFAVAVLSSCRPRPTGTRQADTQGACEPRASTATQAGNIFVNINVGPDGRQTQK